MRSPFSLQIIVPNSFVGLCLNLSSVVSCGSKCLSPYFMSVTCLIPKLSVATLTLVQASHCPSVGHGPQVNKT
eukprot:c34611_g1_i1 orf=2-217(-)